ncbi:haloacid dehalogenase-like hydrolase [Gaiella sp.]|uniref:haloacid dehalogenase-like hydrolase n=1 Tax=Gaiella sp. TaxID=2663207 RepID=UPI002E33AC50|nr:haloacid dehalogenase-like hydrolase [Gaiella sp.]HEX5584010.1 haloacid dehalogenase-like hydrolase [Gaiella sp.]
MANREKEPLALVLDWDGTVTEVDTLHMVNDRFGDPAVFGALEDELGRTLTLDEVIEREIATVTAPLDEVVDYLRREVRVRAGFRELVSEYDPLIVSAGFHELIEPILEREGVAARVLANSVAAEPGGWRARFRDRPPCDVCGERCKRGSVAGLGGFAYVGDGISDRCVSLVAERRFARRSLAVWLDEQGVPYERFEDLHDVARALEAQGTEEGAGDGRGG